MTIRASRCMTPPVHIVIQARMGSSRLPGKIAMPIGGNPLLAHVVRRLQAADGEVPGGVVVAVATSAERGDDRTEALCQALGVRCFRGSERDVLARYVAATAGLPDRATLVRATADNPLYCPLRTAQIIAEHRRLGAEYTAIDRLSYVVPEVMQAGALRAMERLAAAPACREHVTPYFREQAGPFRVALLPSRWQGLRPEFRLTVDTADDLARIRDIYRVCADRDDLFPLEDVYGYLDRLQGARRTDAA